MLHAVAKVLSISADWFFDTLPDPAADEAGASPEAEAAARAAQAFLMSPEGMKMAVRFPGLLPSARRHILALCHAMAEEDDPG